MLLCYLKCFERRKVKEKENGDKLINSGILFLFFGSGDQKINKDNN